MAKFLHLLLACLFSIPLFSQSVEEYYENGKLKSKTPLNDKGVFHGIGYKYHPNGEVATEIPYIDGYIDGILREFYNDGTLQSQCRYTLDKKNGLFSAYYPQGQLKINQTWINGEKSGDMFVFYPNGMLRMYGLLENDSVLFAQRFSDRGMLQGERVSFIPGPIDTSRLPAPEIFCRHGKALKKDHSNPVQVFIPQVPSQFISYASPSGQIGSSGEKEFPLLLTPNPGTREFILYLRIKTHSSARPIMMRTVRIPVI